MLCHMPNHLFRYPGTTNRSRPANTPNQRTGSDRRAGSSHADCRFHSAGYGHGIRNALQRITGKLELVEANTSSSQRAIQIPNVKTLDVGEVGMRQSCRVKRAVCRADPLDPHCFGLTQKADEGVGRGPGGPPYKLHRYGESFWGHPDFLEPPKYPGYRRSSERHCRRSHQAQDAVRRTAESGRRWMV